MMPVRSVTHRIAIWYGVLFTLLFLLLFILIFRDLSRYLVQQADDQLIEKALRNEWYAKEVPIEKIRTSIDYNTEIEGSKKVSYWLCDANGYLIYGSNHEPWQTLELDAALIRDVSRSAAMEKAEIRDRFSAMRIHWIGRNSSLRLGFFQSGNVGKLSYRIGYIRLGDGKVLICATNLTEVDAFLKRSVKVFVILFAIAVVAGATVGYFIAFHAMSGVKGVTRVASNIADGNLDLRVQVNADGVEIEELANTFNSMLDKIQSLLIGLKQVSDDIAHDLRTPVTRIRTLAEMNATSSIDNECRCQMGVIVEESDRLIEMIHTMLEIAQTNSGAVHFEFAELNLSEILSSGFELFQTMAEDKQLGFEYKNAFPLLMIKGNKSRLQRVFANLLDNAIKFTPAGGKICLETKKDAAYIRVDITDSGVGIPLDEQQRIFDRFYRRDPSRSIEGNGLGLCLARAILRAHGGEVMVHSREGEGSCFTVQLPIG